MQLSFSIRRFPAIPQPIVKLLATCLTIVLFVNVFVGFMVYQNPLLSLLDLRNMLFVFLTAAVLAIGLFGLNHFLVFIEHKLKSRWLVKNWQATISAVMALTAVSVFLML